MTLDRATLSLDNLISDPKYNFLNLFHENDDDESYVNSPYDSSTFNSKYIDPLSFTQQIKSNNTVSFMTLNIQSISAKFAEFSELISIFDNANCAPDVICLQELWQFSPFLNVSLPGYHPLCFKLRNKTQGGGSVFISNLILPSKS